MTGAQLIEHKEILVVGAGPAGLAAAHTLAQGGARVQLIDRSLQPGTKACGGALTARAWAEAGLDPAALPDHAAVHRALLAPYKAGQRTSSGHLPVGMWNRKPLTTFRTATAWSFITGSRATRRDSATAMSN